MEHRLGNSLVQIYASSAGDVVDVEVRFVGGGVATQMPVVYFILLDTSKSMSEFGKLEQALGALTELIYSMDPYDYVAVYTFDDKVKKLLPLTTAERARARLGGLRVKTGSYTLLYEALYEAIEEMRRKVHPGYLRRIIVITDGEPWPTYTELSHYEALGRYAFGNGITISALGVGVAYNEKVLYALAAHSGGAWYHISNPGAVKQMLMIEAKRAKNVVLKRPRVGVLNAEVLDVKKIGATVASLPKSNAVELEDVAAGEVLSVVFRVRPMGRPAVWVEAEGYRIEEEVAATSDKTAVLAYQFAEALQKVAMGERVEIEVFKEATKTTTLPQAWREKAERMIQLLDGPRDKEVIAEATTVIYSAGELGRTVTYMKPHVDTPLTPQAREGGCFIVNIRTGASMPVENRALLGRDDFRLIADDETLKYISRKIGNRAHIEVMIQGGEVYVRDAGSSGGTYVNGKKIGNEFEKISPEDVINLGKALDIKIICPKQGA